MDGKTIGEHIRDACAEIPHGRALNSGGNLGMVFIATSISEHANAIAALARAIERFIDSDPFGDRRYGAG